MSKIFDNIETRFEEGLHAILTNVGVERADFCVGYFNLRGNQRTQGEVSRREGGKIFGFGSRTPVAITIQVKDGK